MDRSYAFFMPRCAGIPVEELSIRQLQHHLTCGNFSAQDLTTCYLEWIRTINPYIRAVIEVNPDALSIAEASDEERRSGNVRGILHGLPFLVKDNISSADKMQTTAGSSMLIGSIVPDDAKVLQNLRLAGAVLLGHANMSEWAAMRASYYSEGYSSRGGQGRNPYNLAEDPGGSSSGSASAVASNLCVFSLGTETDGSIIFPASRNGVVGIKPTVGLTSRLGIIPESSTLDTVGAFGRTVEDAAIVLDAIVDDGRLLGFGQATYASSISSQNALRGARFGLPWTRVWESATRLKGSMLELSLLRQTIDQIRQAGATIVEHADFPSADEIIPESGWDWDYGSKIGHPDRSEFTVVKTDFYNDLSHYLSTLKTNPQRIHSVEDVIIYNVQNTKEEGGIPGTHGAWPTGQDSFENSAETGGIRDDIYFEAMRYMRQKSQAEGIDAAINSHGHPLDALLVPSLADGGSACQVAAKAGYPMISLPVGTDDQGVPIGLALIQSANSERALIKYSSAIEDLIKGRSQPHFRNLDAQNFMYVGAKPES